MESLTLGTEKPWKVWAAVALAVVALVVIVRAFTSSPAAVASVQEQATATQQSGQQGRKKRVRGSKGAAVLTASADPRLRLDLLKSTETMDYEGGGRNIFRAEAEPEIPKPVAPVITSKPQPPAPVAVAPPPPPPIPLRFYGFANKSGEAKKIFLAEGEDVFVAGEGDMVARRYRVGHIGVNSVQITDVLNNNTQTIPLTQS